MNKETLKNIIMEVLNEEISKEESIEEELSTDPNAPPADAAAPRAPAPPARDDSKGMSASDMRMELIKIAKDTRTLSAIAPPERVIITATVQELIAHAVSKNIASGNVATLLKKLFAIKK